MNLLGSKGKIPHIHKEPELITSLGKTLAAVTETQNHSIDFYWIHFFIAYFYIHYNITYTFYSNQK